MTQKIFLTRSFLFIALSALTSCFSAADLSNEAEFKKKFGADIARINADRIDPNTQNSRAAAAATADFANNAPQNKLPDDMFDLVYNTELSPPFVVSGLEFDKIKIPDRDRYGVRSALNNKQYLLAGNQTLQKNIDQLIKSQNSEEVELSEILIKEQRQLKKQQKLAKIFGENSRDESSKNEVKIATIESKEKDELHNAIALQIIRQNISQSSAHKDQQKNPPKDQQKK